MKLLTHILLTMIIFIIMDIIWFSVSISLIYQPKFAEIQNNNFDMIDKIHGGLFAWFLLALGIHIFVLKISINIKNAILYGLLYGLIIYGVYNGTNYTTFKNYNLDIFIPDLLWGCFVCSLVSAISFYILSK